VLIVNSLLEDKKVCFTLCLALLNELIVKSDRDTVRNMMHGSHELCEDCFRMKCVDECICDCHGYPKSIHRLTVCLKC